ncbi:MAG: phage tail protein [Defluviitaleaceae bacterium]|nr:phage tail protein [Defluviitaleaceae bacterium]
MSVSNIPLPTHNFVVRIDSESIPFSKIKSFEVESETEVIVKGGESRLMHSVAKQRDTEKILTMERNAMSDDFTILRVGTVFKRMEIIVLDQNRHPRKMYEARFVILKKRSLSELNATNSKVFVENLEFIYRELTEVPV